MTQILYEKGKYKDLTFLTFVNHKKIEFVYSIGTLTFTHFRDIC